MAELDGYDVVILSDIGSNSLLLSPDTFERSLAAPNRLALLRDWVAAGGGLIMVGGYLTFQGIEGKGRYAGSAVEEALPVLISPFDDRVERPEGVAPTVSAPDHPLADGLPATWPEILGYNRLTRAAGGGDRGRGRATTLCSSAGISGRGGRSPLPPIADRTGRRRHSSSGTATRRSGRTSPTGRRDQRG